MLIRFEGTEFDSSVLTLIKGYTKRLISVYLTGLEAGRETLWILRANKSLATCRECEFEHQKSVS